MGIAIGFYTGWTTVKLGYNVPSMGKKYNQSKTKKMYNESEISLKKLAMRNSENE